MPERIADGTRPVRPRAITDRRRISIRIYCVAPFPITSVASTVVQTVLAMNRKFTIAASEPFPSGMIAAALMSQCLVHVLRRLGEDENSPMPWLHALSDPRLGRAVETILDDPAAEHTVESLADTASMSRSAFAERFTNTIGATPMGLVNQMRMGRAEQLLQQDDSRSVDEIAERVGFASRSHFSRAFKKHSGMSPAEFRLKGHAEAG